MTRSLRAENEWLRSCVEAREQTIKYVEARHDALYLRNCAKASVVQLAEAIL